MSINSRWRMAVYNLDGKLAQQSGKLQQDETPQNLDKALQQGWEPFAVTKTPYMVYVRRRQISD